MLELDGVEVDYCAGCGGLWLDAGELGLIVRGHLDVAEPQWLRDGRGGERRCPLCREKMDVALLARPGVEVDFCRRRHGLWLDKGELQQIISVEAGDERVGRLREFCARLFPVEKARSAR